MNTVGCLLEIFNNNGNLVFAKRQCDETEKIDIGNLAAGTYVIRITHDKFTTTTRFVKK